MRKLAVLALSAALVMGTMTGCGSTNSDAKNSDNAGTNKSASSETGFDMYSSYSEHRSMYSYVRLSIDRCTATYV